MKITGLVYVIQKCHDLITLVASQTMRPPSLDVVIPSKEELSICFQFSQFPFLTILLIQPSLVAV